MGIGKEMGEILCKYLPTYCSSFQPLQIAQVKSCVRVLLYAKLGVPNGRVQHFYNQQQLYMSVCTMMV